MGKINNMLDLSWLRKKDINFVSKLGKYEKWLKLLYVISAFVFYISGIGVYAWHFLTGEVFGPFILLGVSILPLLGARCLSKKIKSARGIFEEVIREVYRSAIDCDSKDRQLLDNSNLSIKKIDVLEAEEKRLHEIIAKLVASGDLSMKMIGTIDRREQQSFDRVLVSGVGAKQYSSVPVEVSGRTGAVETIYAISSKKHDEVFYLRAMQMYALRARGNGCDNVKLGIGSGRLKYSYLGTRDDIERSGGNEQIVIAINDFDHKHRPAKEKILDWLRARGIVKGSGKKLIRKK